MKKLLIILTLFLSCSDKEETMPISACDEMMSATGDVCVKAIKSSYEVGWNRGFARALEYTKNEHKRYYYDEIMALRAVDTVEFNYIIDNTYNE
jgi:hypothetical protein